MKGWIVRDKEHAIRDFSKPEISKVQEKSSIRIVTFVYSEPIKHMSQCKMEAQTKSRDLLGLVRFCHVDIIFAITHSIAALAMPQCVPQTRPNLTKPCQQAKPKIFPAHP